ncbi:kinase-like protein [Dendrothele bispora CBS 962.96]|uniref:Kinase-like protein n=1 Tax=Dendrothele bispora (strain CBS 962.96) TaxID=1314807 RepID=A0A4S8MUB2_DENBC|nr:kinase-like protein [Dendrothele bispora CBS 962.96]
MPRVWYICMDEVPGVPLHKVIHTLSPQQLDHIASQLKAILDEMHSISAPHLGSVNGGPFRNQYFYLRSLQPKKVWTSVPEFIDHFRQLLMLFGTVEYTEELLADFPQDGAFCFTHGDLIPQNILVNGSTITGIIDWSTAGFYPAFWEYCRMHEEASNYPGWSHILDIIFPAPRREREIAAFHRLRGVLEYNL